jgi:hypothetical protein
MPAAQFKNFQAKIFSVDIGAQNSAVKIEGDTITVTRSGNGSVSGDRINCGGSCSMFTVKGSSVTLTAKSGSDSVFSGWSGACSGTQATCNVIANGVHESHSYSRGTKGINLFAPRVIFRDISQTGLTRSGL